MQSLESYGAYGRYFRRPERLIGQIIAIAAAVLAVGSAVAAPPQIELSIADTDRAGRYARHLAELGAEIDRPQGEVLQQFIDIFLIGVDTAKPARADLITDEAPTRYRLHVPVKDIRDFRTQNLKPVGIPSSQSFRDRELFKLGGRRGAAFDGWMRYGNPAGGEYAFIAEKQDEVPATLADPSDEIRKKLNGQYDAVFSLTNDPTEEGLEQAVQERLGRYLAERDEAIEALKPAKGETPEEFEYRKMLASHQFDDYAMLYAESKLLEAFSKLDIENNSARVDASLEALPSTRLEGMMRLLGQSASRFAAVPLGSNPVLSGRVNIKLDQYRTDQFLAQLRAWRAATISGIKADQDRTAEEKTSGEDAVSRLVDSMRKVVVAGSLDGFLEIADSTAGRQTFGGIHVPNGEDFFEALKAFENTKSISKLELNVDKIGELDVHRVGVSEGMFSDLVTLAGTSEMLVAIAPDTLWMAAGPDARNTLEQTINQLDGEAAIADELVFRLDAKLATIADAVINQLPETDDPAIRQMIKAALATGNDSLFLNFSVEDAKMTGEMEIKSGILGFIGRYIARFSRENLDG
ncbi:hypothetical protein [Stratiformator vulcanicus]|uniref:Uncharacterized protein n=1 Tax=Stratiformator vulcanicus TaxID=2527980 RepID=A0A517R1X2_9PLAN|nr:hypothetical protein [Stratiformator vulcanicus]QDT37851.1 hypothetical protein Pan189_22330 [Stratiformator vulcanicus]